MRVVARRIHPPGPFPHERDRRSRSERAPRSSHEASATVRVDSFDFELPPERIAQRPIEPRDAARLLVLDPETDSLSDRHAYELPDLLPHNAVVVVNDTRVIPARLLGRKTETGGKVELLLVRKVGEGTFDHLGERVPAEEWRAMGKASKAFRFPTTVLFGDPPSLVAILRARADDGLLDVTLASTDGTRPSDVLERLGHVPLPPYIRREDDAQDVERYQTVYATREGAVAAPTAGLHLTHRLIGALSARGIQFVTVTLHVGPGTFQPVMVEDLDDHPMHEEWYEVSRHAALTIEQARQRGAPVVAVGTTSVRALESAADPERPGLVCQGQGVTRLLIQPGYRFRVVDAMLTNFHLPKSTLLALVSAMAGRDRIFRAYRHAIEQEYRFYSYGDAMLILGHAKDDEP